MRSKEEAHDYRYFPDPDLLPLEFDDAFVEALKADLPELPDDKKERFVRDLGLSVYDASVLVSEKAIADYFEAVAEGRDGKAAANWVINDLLGALNKAGKTIEETPVSPAQLGGIIDLIKDGTISGKLAKDVFEILWNEGGDPAEIVESRGMKQVTDTGAIEKAVDEIIAANPDQAGKGQGEAVARRLVRRAGDEGDRRQGQSAGGAGPGKIQTRHRGVTMFFVRTASERDLEKVRALLAETWHATYDTFYGAEKVNELTAKWHSIEALRARLQRKHSEFVVADNGRELAGMGYAAMSESLEKTAVLHQLYVLPKHQRHGVGRDMFAELETCFPDAERMRVEVEPQNLHALAFYRAHGFVEVAKHPVAATSSPAYRRSSWKSAFPDLSRRIDANTGASASRCG